MFETIFVVAKSGLPRSIRKYIRGQKMRIRAEHVFDKEKQEKEIQKLYEKLKINYDKNEVEKL